MRTRRIVRWSPVQRMANSMNREIQSIFSGFGGQGVLFAGKVMAYTGLIEDREVSWLPSYGPEMRGGTANCSVTLSDDPVGSPLVTSPNVLVAMNQPSYDKFVADVVPGGIVVFDSDLIDASASPAAQSGVNAVSIPATSMAEAAGLAGLSNIVLLGCLWKNMPFCEEATLGEAIKKCVPARKAHLIDKNMQALALGMGA